MSRPKRLTLFWALVILAALQLWRPYFFLTDDNLVGWLPVVVDVGRHLCSGRSPFELSTLNGGHFHLLNDPASLCLWNPLVLALGVLGQTRCYVALVDLFVAFNLILGALLFTALLELWRRQYHLKISDRRIAFLSLSYTFSGFAILIDSSWLNFSVNQTVLPLWLLGLFWPSRRAGVSLVTLGFVDSLLCGHLSPFLYSVLFLTALVVCLGAGGNSWEFARRWAAGGALSLVVAAPLLWPALEGFGALPRAQSAGEMVRFVGGVPPLILLLSPFLGIFCRGMGDFQMVAINPGISYVVAGCAASHCVWHSIGPRDGEKRHAGLPPLEKCLLYCLTLAAIFVVRPDALQQLMWHLPLYKSLRYAFREVFDLLFFFHCWLALQPVRMSRLGRHTTMALGTGILIYSLAACGPPSMLGPTPDHDLVVSGKASRYWAQVKPLLEPGTRILPVIDPSLLQAPLYSGDGYGIMPQSLLGSSNFPALFNVDSVSGYKILGLGGTIDAHGVPGHNGIWAPAPARALLARDPTVRLIHLVSYRPLVIQLEDGHDRYDLPVPKN